jgi:hypothetical protein
MLSRFVLTQLLLENVSALSSNSVSTASANTPMGLKH